MDLHKPRTRKLDEGGLALVQVWGTARQWQFNRYSQLAIPVSAWGHQAGAVWLERFSSGVQRIRACMRRQAKWQHGVACTVVTHFPEGASQ